ncbi:MAG TPA: hypothetical protein VMW08_17720 [Acidimicrobiales bacterium]|nr:hypothetical protein [Acidimicrobiales bacterium]
MQATRFLVQRLKVDGIVVETTYADLYVVVRDDADGPAPTDWEAQAHGIETRNISAGRHHLECSVPDGSVLSGEAVVRFSDGTRHLFRGDSDLLGFAG